jgi:hypothetical protein
MPEPIGNSSRYDPSQLRCAADIDEESAVQSAPGAPPPLSPPSTGPSKPGAAVANLVEQFQRTSGPPLPAGDKQSGVVVSVGAAVSAESVFPSVATPVTEVPGGVSAAAGFYVDFGRLEVGSYRRLELRWAGGSYAGAGLEAGVTGGRENFEGAGTAVFAEGGGFGRFGVAAGPSSVGASFGVGAGAAAGVALTQTEAEPILRADQALDWGASPWRRGP